MTIQRTFPSRQTLLTLHRVVLITFDGVATPVRAEYFAGSEFTQDNGNWSYILKFHECDVGEMTEEELATTEITEICKAI